MAYQQIEQSIAAIDEACSHLSECEDGVMLVARLLRETDIDVRYIALVERVRSQLSQAFITLQYVESEARRLR